MIRLHIGKYQASNNLLIVVVATLVFVAGFSVALVKYPTVSTSVKNFGNSVVSQVNSGVNKIEQVFTASTTGVGLSVQLISLNGSKYNYNDNQLTPLDVQVGGVSILLIQWAPSMTIQYTGTITGGSCTIAHQLSDNAGISIPSPAGQTVSIPTTLSSGGSIGFTSASLSATALNTGGYGAYGLTITVNAQCTLTFADGTSSTLTSSKSATVSYTRPQPPASGITSLSVTFSPTTTVNIGCSPKCP